jgi:hypothetical protein
MPPPSSVPYAHSEQPSSTTVLTPPPATSEANGAFLTTYGDESAVPQLPPPPTPPLLAASPPLPSGCDQFLTPDALDRWLEVTALQNNAVLSSHAVDAYDAHTAIRHLKSILLNEYQVFVAMPPHLRKDKAFTSWLNEAVTLSRQFHIPQYSYPLHWLAFSANARHVHSSVGMRLL